MRKKVFFVLVLFVCLILFLNTRIPFYRNISGPWSLGYGFSKEYPDSISVSKNKIYSFENLNIDNDSTQFMADPFFVKEKDTFYIFFEHKIKNIHPAKIGLLTSKDGYNYNYKGTVLKEKFHLSYPQVFKYKNEYYMIPETQSAENVLLYKAEKFPYDWKICDTLIANIKLKDPSIFLSDTLNIIAGSDANLTMQLYTSNSLFGDWKLHKNPNPLMGSESRPGGRFYNAKDGLILPVQNSSHGYGYGISLYKFKFNKSNYEVEKIKNLFLKRQKNIPEFNAGMHQLDIQDVDGQLYYVYDGNSLKNNDTQLNIKAVLKMNFLDFKQWLKNL
jgi:hypothetical protein